MVEDERPTDVLASLSQHVNRLTAALVAIGNQVEQLRGVYM